MMFVLWVWIKFFHIRPYILCAVLRVTHKTYGWLWKSTINLIWCPYTFINHQRFSLLIYICRNHMLINRFFIKGIVLMLRKWIRFFHIQSYMLCDVLRMSHKTHGKFWKNATHQLISRQFCYVPSMREYGW